MTSQHRRSLARLALALAGALLGAACGGEAAESTSATGSGGSGGDAGSATSSASGAGATQTETVDGRAFSLYVPSAAKDSAALPLVLFLHHLGGSATDGETTFSLQALAESRGFLYAASSGTSEMGPPHWNATDACCDPSHSADDSSYLAHLIATVSANHKVDSKRVFIMGHSNGGFMSHRMACDHADQVAAIASISGAMWSDKSQCKPAEAVSVLEIHAMADPVIAYGGGTFMGGIYPAAKTTVGDWAELDKCATTSTEGTALTLSGAKTSTESYAGCASGASVALWSVDVADHLPITGEASATQVLDWLFAHPKP